MNCASTLQVDALTATFASRELLDHICLTFAPHGIHAIMGPGGAGKSTLLRVVSGQSLGSTITLTGEVHTPHQGVSLLPQHLPTYDGSGMEYLRTCLPTRSELTQAEQDATIFAHITQLDVDHLASYLEDPFGAVSLAARLMIRLVGESLKAPSVICVDEPFVDLHDAPEQIELCMRLLKQLAQRCTIIWVSHHIALVRAHADQVTLLVSGQLVETAPAQAFFHKPSSPITQTYIEQGNCSLPAAPEDALQEEEDHTPAPPLELVDPLMPDPMATQERQGPSNFHWVIAGRLGGCAQPGLLEPLSRDLDALERVGCTILVTLTEHPLPVLERPDIRVIFFPFDDMCAPPVNHAINLCARLQNKLLEGERIVFHCKAGKGRTGTMLCAMLIWNGMSADEALAHARTAYPIYVQSQEQLDFLRTFSHHPWVASRCDSSTP